VLLLCLLCVCSLPWVCLNISPSVPLGLYRLHHVPDTLTYGQLMLIDVPIALAPWWPRKTPLLKPVAGLPGDVLTIREGHFYINATDCGPVSAVAAARAGAGGMRGRSSA
jgi:type IV secretory pathway protease TraF